MMRRWGRCVGCMARWKQNLREGGSDCLLNKVIGPIKVQTRKEFLMGLWRGEREGIKPKAGDADL